jgi:dienelactone hydrolase
MITRRRILLGVVFLILLSFFGFTYWAYTPQGPAKNALDSLVDTENVSVTVAKQIIFTPSETLDTGLIFYPGGHVDPRSYGRIAHQIADQGYLVIIPKMPFNLAVIDKRAAVRILAAYPEIDNWVIGGHSLGGAMAASLVFDEQDMFKGLVLLAAYPPKNNDISSLDLFVTVLYSSNDQIATPSEIEESMHLLPFDAQGIIIEGGNHAQFGDYGVQNGDGEATIRPDEQQKIVIEAIINSLKQVP